jgi:hypothetical protein
MADYIWEYNGFGPRGGVSKEKAGSIFLHDKSRPFKAWWNGCGIDYGAKTLQTAKRTALKYARWHATKKIEEANSLIQDAEKSILEIDLQLNGGRR